MSIQKKVHYKGYVITTKSNELLNGKWDCEIEIGKFDNGNLSVKQYFGQKQYQNITDSQAAGVKYAIRIIDGEVDGISPPI